MYGRIKFHKNTTTMAESYQLLKRTGNRIKYKQETMLVKSRETSRTLKKNWEIQSWFSEKCKSLWLGIADVRVILDKKIRKMQKKVLIKLTLRTFWDKRTNKNFIASRFPALLKYPACVIIGSLCYFPLHRLVVAISLVFRQRHLRKSHLISLWVMIAESYLLQSDLS